MKVITILKLLLSNISANNESAVVFKCVFQKSEVRGVDQSTLNEILSHLPAQAPQCIERALSSTPATSPDEEGR